MKGWVTDSDGVTIEEVTVQKGARIVTIKSEKDDEYDLVQIVASGKKLWVLKSDRRDEGNFFSSLLISGIFGNTCRLFFPLHSLKKILLQITAFLLFSPLLFFWAK